MTTRAKVLVTICVVLFGVGIYLCRGYFVSAQPNAQPPARSTPTEQNYLSANQQKNEFPTLVNLNCQGCHLGGKIPDIKGDKFHKDARTALEQSVHAQVGPSGKPNATCIDCHTRAGDMKTALPAEDPLSTVNRANLPQTCGRCHSDARESFKHSIHGSIRESGETKAATCADCHGSHSIEPAKDIRSQVNRTNTAEAVCVKCHSDKVADWETSSHGMALKAGSSRAPTCTTCHTAVSHLPAPMTIREFNMSMVAKCSACHQQQAPSYRDTFHGQSNALNFKQAATCADCHTPHHNLPASNPDSSVNAANRLQTCSKCHTNATANFATYDPHPQPHDPSRSALVYYVTMFMKYLLLGVFGFFGLHTLLWLQRSIVDFFRNHKKKEEEENDAQWVLRFNNTHRLTHVLIVASFIILAATGLPLMFYYTSWAGWLETHIGGMVLSRFLHRAAAVVTFAYGGIHLYWLVKTAIIKRQWRWLYGPESMVPRLEDIRDCFFMFRWFLYLGPRPKLDRWTYWEKFDYFAVFWGIPVIGFSGLMLWFPTFFGWFLPGVVLNLAMIIHSEEALLATGFIFAFHFFHNHLRPENFPMDISVFTGKIPLARFKEEREAEYQRLVDEGKLETIFTDPPTRKTRLWSNIFGATAYIVGLLLVVAIFYSLIVYRS
ncbi:MAG: hypothetical protein JO314_13395 [Acidobacteria bacterium]|nr:hypothetical protein [Acidobacteriota bacterium]